MKTYLTFAFLVIGSICVAQNTRFQDILTEFPIYELPLDPQSLEKTSNILTYSDFNEVFFAYFEQYPFILKQDGSKAHATLAGQIENESIEYAAGKYDQVNVYPLGRIYLDPNYISVIICKSNMELDQIFLYNFTLNGEVKSAILLTLRNKFAPTTYGSYKEYSFIQEDTTIVKRIFSETYVQNVSFYINGNGIFEVSNSETDTEYYNETNWGIIKKQAELDKFAADGSPVLKN